MRKYLEIDYHGNLMRGFHDDANSQKVVIITHGIGGNKLGHKFVFKQMADNCVKRGLSTIRIDFVGSGESDGDFADTMHSDQVNQLKAIIKYATKELRYKEIYLCSTTIGCYSVWHAAKSSDIKAIVNWNPICNYDRYEASHKKHANEDGSIDMKGLYTKPTYTKDLEKLERDVPRLDLPVMFLQGELDGEYKYPDAKQVCRKNKWKYQMIPNGNHLWEGNNVRELLFQTTIDFILEN